MTKILIKLKVLKLCGSNKKKGDVRSEIAWRLLFSGKFRKGKGKQYPVPSIATFSISNELDVDKESLIMGYR